MSEQQQTAIANQAKGLAKWFSIDLCIKVFGIVIWEYHFPPKND